MLTSSYPESIFFSFWLIKLLYFEIHLVWLCDFLPGWICPVQWLIIMSNFTLNHVTVAALCT